MPVRIYSDHCRLVYIISPTGRLEPFIKAFMIGTVIVGVIGLSQFIGFDVLMSKLILPFGYQGHFFLMLICVGEFTVSSGIIAVRVTIVVYFIFNAKWLLANKKYMISALGAIALLTTATAGLKSVSAYLRRMNYYLLRKPQPWKLLCLITALC